MLIEKTEMRMIRWILGICGLGRMRDVGIRKRVGVANVNHRMREGRLLWMGHVVRRVREI